MADNSQADTGSRDNHETEILERGHIFFFYRPRVDEEDPEGLSDVQRFFIVLRAEPSHRMRLLTVGRKRLPDVERHERNWGFVDVVSSDIGDIRKVLEPYSYGTKTRGEQHQPGARVAGEGVYAVALRDGRMHLAYHLDKPEKPGDVQHALNIEPQASFALSVKNPERSSPRGRGLRQQDEPDYPDRLQEEFRGRRFATEDIALLDYEGAEFLLIGATPDPERRYDLGLENEGNGTPDQALFRLLRAGLRDERIKPLFEGRWA